MSLNRLIELYDNYVAIGILPPRKNQMRITYYNALPQTTTIIAKQGENVLACVSVINNDQLILPIERELEKTICLTPGFRRAQVLDLAVKKEFNNCQLIFMLMKYVYTYAKEYLHVDSLQIAVRPKHGDFF